MFKVLLAKVLAARHLARLVFELLVHAWILMINSLQILLFVNLRVKTALSQSNWRTLSVNNSRNCRPCANLWQTLHSAWRSLSLPVLASHHTYACWQFCCWTFGISQHNRFCLSLSCALLEVFFDFNELPEQNFIVFIDFALPFFFLEIQKLHFLHLFVGLNRSLPPLLFLFSLVVGGFVACICVGIGK